MAAQQGRHAELRAQLSSLARQAGLSHFFAYILFNDSTVVGVSTVFDVFCLSTKIPNPSPFSLIQLSKLLASDTDEKPAGHIIRRCHECTFVFYASGAAGRNAKKLLIQLEQVGIKVMTLLCPLLKTIYPPSTDLFITSNAKLRERVLLASRWPRPTLTAKECACLRYAAQGLTVVRIAEVMHNSRHTISEYMQMIKHKLNANTISEALFYSLYLGVMNPLRNTNESAIYKTTPFK